MGSQVHTKFQRNRPNRYQETEGETFMEKGCARAHVQMHSIYDLWKALVNPRTGGGLSQPRTGGGGLISAPPPEISRTTQRIEKP